MKYLIPILVIIGLAGGILSLFAMNHENGDCIAAAIAGIECMESLSPQAFLSIHADFLRNFSEALVGGFVAALILLSLVAVRLNLVIGNSAIAANPGVLAFQSLLFNLSHLRQKLIGWLSFHQNSPSLISRT